MNCRRSPQSGCRPPGVLIAGLPPKQRQVVELVYLAQMPITEVAERVNCPTEALRQSLHEARRRLQEALFHADKGLESL